jgi:hypothetical protein
LELEQVRWDLKSCESSTTFYCIAESPWSFLLRERERKKPTSIIFFFSFLRRSINSNEKMSDMFIYMNRMYASVIDEDIEAI